MQVWAVEPLQAAGVEPSSSAAISPASATFLVVTATSSATSRVIASLYVGADGRLYAFSYC
jgi:ligand-binding sensor domain-containing protein